MKLVFTYSGSPRDVALLIRARGLVDATAAAERVRPRKRRTHSASSNPASGSVEEVLRPAPKRTTGSKSKRSSVAPAQPAPKVRVSRRRSRSIPRPEPTPAPPAPVHVAPPPPDRGKAKFDAWLKEQDEARAAAARELTDRAFSSITADVEDVPLDVAISRRP